jgi:hypothetical protein
MFKELTSQNLIIEYLGTKLVLGKKFYENLQKVPFSVYFPLKMIIDKVKRKKYHIQNIKNLSLKCSSQLA